MFNNIINGLDEVNPVESIEDLGKNVIQHATEITLNPEEELSVLYSLGQVNLSKGMDLFTSIQLNEWLG